MTEDDFITHAGFGEHFDVGDGNSFGTGPGDSGNGDQASGKEGFSFHNSLDELTPGFAQSCESAVDEVLVWS